MSLEIHWPPIMSWTTLIPYKGAFHFVAISHGKKDNIRFAYLVSVLYGEISLRVTFNELNDLTKWLPGWVEISDDHSIRNSSKTKDFYLYSSEDSGLPIPITTNDCRPWDSKEG